MHANPKAFPGDALPADQYANGSSDSRQKTGILDKGQATSRFERVAPGEAYKQLLIIR
jgi:hypothetical protein